MQTGLRVSDRLAGRSASEATQFHAFGERDRALVLCGEPQTDLTVEEIATMVGYRDNSAFRQVFKKVIGLTPTEYRSRFGLVGTRRR